MFINNTEITKNLVNNTLPHRNKPFSIGLNKKPDKIATDKLSHFPPTNWSKDEEHKRLSNA